MKGGWDRACPSCITVAGTTFKPHLAFCPLPGPGFRGPLSASSSSLSRPCKGLWRPLLWRGSQGEGGREGRFRMPPSPSIQRLFPWQP